MKKIFLLLFLINMFATAAMACRFTVREIGFADFDTEDFILYFFKDQSVSAEQARDFKKISFAALLDANVQTEIVDVAAQKDHPAMQFYQPATNNGWPDLVLMAQDGKSLTIRFPDEQSHKETIWSALEKLITSTLRENLLQEIVPSYGVILVIEGVDQAENKKVNQQVEDAVAEITKMMDSMPKPVKKAPKILHVCCEEIAREDVFLRSLGYDANAEKKAAVAVLYGRGRQMGRLLRGEGIQANVIRNLLTFVGADCECGLERSWLLGRMIPLRWDSERQAEVVSVHGFDAENPLIKAEMSQILSISPDKDRPKDASKTLYGYTEGEMKLVMNSNDNQAEAISASTGLGRGIWLIIFTFAIVLVAGLVIYLRASRRE